LMLFMRFAWCALALGLPDSSLPSSELQRPLAAG